MRENGRDEWSGLLEALEDVCAVCGGRGTVDSPDWRAWYERAEELARVAEAARRATGFTEGDAPAIVTAVERAIGDHTAARPAGDRRIPCPTCGGTGRVLTPLGTRLAELLTRHGFHRECP
ncbi:hypothetical protein GCM10009678_37920 [Actinomadura kijaniata]|uniref:Ribonuclease G/E n=1 Tax=Actinomadura namibiensis TaxID=182080 RepID=A0A7W3LYD3_ACTNM|nr:MULTISPECIES: hypothetical protein [Actinomadura]MBA8956615.1 Ribonuclease G/E [Actinomadura namibiensis]